MFGALGRAGLVNSNFASKQGNARHLQTKMKIKNIKNEKKFHVFYTLFFVQSPK